MTRVVHVTLGASAAGSLRQALDLLGKAEPVVFLADDLNVGPLEPSDAETRARWIEDELGYEADPEQIARIEAFWAEATSPAVTPVAWLSGRDAAEYAGLLELLWRRRDDVVKVVDINGVDFGKPDMTQSFGYVRADQMVAHGLFEYATLLPDVTRARYRAAWDQLRRENAALRIVDASGLRSAPIDHFDELIAGRTTDKWQKSARVVGDSLWTIGNSGYRQIRDSFIWARLCTLVDDGVLEGKGDFASMHTSWVRQPSHTGAEIAGPGS
jgi:hypothetical protein